MLSIIWINPFLEDLVDQFRAKLEDRPEGQSDAVAAIETLLDLIRSSKGKHSPMRRSCEMSVYLAGTIAGLQDEIKTATKALIDAQTSTVSVSSGCELFVRFISLTSKMGEEEVSRHKDYINWYELLVFIGRILGN